jgi:uncharacterized protein YcfJ
MKTYNHPAGHSLPLALRCAVGSAALLACLHAAAQITLYEDDGHRGRAFTTSEAVRNLANRGFNDRASSAVVGAGRWEVCENADFGGTCRVLRSGSYDSLRALGLNDRISSLRPARQAAVYDNEAPPPQPAPTYEYRRRPNEAVFQVPVTSVRAVVGPPERRCWVERQDLPAAEREAPNVGRGIAGALIGGVLGHQIGGGTGKDLATVGGAVAGAVIGANSGRGGNAPEQRDVRRCETVASGTPAYWDVGYTFRGTHHQAQMSTQPGRSIAVNGRGEPRQ